AGCNVMIMERNRGRVVPFLSYATVFTVQHRIPLALHRLRDAVPCKTLLPCGTSSSSCPLTADKFRNPRRGYSTELGSPAHAQCVAYKSGISRSRLLLLCWWLG